MQTQSTMPWAQTPGGLVVPMAMPMPVPMAPEQYATPEFLQFMNGVNQELPAAQDWIGKSLAARPAQTQEFDQFGYASIWQGVKERQAARGMSDDMLRTMAYRCPPAAAIINTYCNECAAFCQLPESETDVGIRVELRDPDREPTKEEKQEMRGLEDFLLECALPEVEGLSSEMTLDQFIKMIVKDSLTLDFATFENIPGANRERYPAVAFRPIDAEQIRLTEPTEYQPKRTGVANIVAVQTQRGEVVAEYTREEIAWGVRNPSTAQSRMGYGTSELEHCTGIISGILLGNEYNVQQFVRSSIPPGVLSIFGNLHPETLESFKRQWQAQMQGVNNWWNTPIIGTKDGSGVNYVRFRDSNRDMEFHQFLAFEITVLCSSYLIHPEDIGMQSWAPQTSTLNQPSPQSRIDASKDRGLKPLLKMIIGLINRRILWIIDKARKYIARWKNLDPADEERELRLRQTRLETGITLPRQEIAEMDREIHEFADVPTNPNQFQVYMQQHGMGMQGPGPGEGEQPEVEGIPGLSATENRGQNEEEEGRREQGRMFGAVAGQQEKEDQEEDRHMKRGARKSLKRGERIIEVSITDD